MGDVKFISCPIFELKDNGYFEMIEDNEFMYEKSVVENDKSWLIFEIDGDKDEVNLINNS